MKFNELPQNMQKSLLEGRKKTVFIAGIIFTVFFLALTALCFFIGHGFEKLWFIPAICVFIGFVGILLELKEPTNRKNQIKSFDSYSFSTPSASESN